MDSPQEEGFDSINWGRAHDEDQGAMMPPSLRANGKDRQPEPAEEHTHLPPDRNADAVDNAGIGQAGFLECTVDTPQKENDGTKDAYISYLVTTHVRALYSGESTSDMR